MSDAEKARDAAEELFGLASSLHWLRVAVQREVDFGRLTPCPWPEDALFDLRADADQCRDQVEELACDLQYEDDSEKPLAATDKRPVPDWEVISAYCDAHPEEVRAWIAELKAENANQAAADVSQVPDEVS
jgi:hypothetical protein